MLSILGSDQMQVWIQRLGLGDLGLTLDSQNI